MRQQTTFKRQLVDLHRAVQVQVRERDPIHELTSNKFACPPW